MSRLITVEDIRTCREVNKKKCHFMWRHLFYLFHENTVFLIMLVCILFGGVICMKHEVFDSASPWFIPTTLINVLIPIYLLVLILLEDQAHGKIVFTGKCVYIDQLMLGRPLPTEYLDREQRKSLKKLVNGLRVYILDGREHVTDEMLWDVEYLFKYLWDCEDRLPKKHELTFQMGRFDSKGSPIAKFTGTAHISGELEPKLIHEECAKTAGIDASMVSRKLWISMGGRAFVHYDESDDSPEELGHVLECDHDHTGKKECEMVVFLTLKRKSKKTRRDAKIEVTTTAEEAPVISVDDELACQVCYSSSSSHIVCTHCHRAVVCPDCAVQIVKSTGIEMSPVQNVPNNIHSRGVWSEILDENWLGARPAFKTNMVARLAKKKENNELEGRCEESIQDIHRFAENPWS